MTFSGKVAEKRRTWIDRGSILDNGLEIEVDSSGRFRTLPLDSHALISETLLVQHVVGFIKNQKLQLANIELLAANDIHNGTWGSNDDGGSDRFTSRQGAGDGGSHFQIFDESANSHDNTLNLTSKLSARRQSQGLRLTRLRPVDSSQDGSDEGSRLSGSRLRLGQHISGRVAQHQRQGLALDLGRLQEVKS